MFTINGSSRHGFFSHLEQISRKATSRKILEGYTWPRTTTLAKPDECAQLIIDCGIPVRVYS